MMNRLIGFACVALLTFAGSLRAQDFRRGDGSGNGYVDIGDSIRSLHFLFLGGAAPGCFDAADANDDGSLDITDGIFGVNYLFLGGPPLPAPGPDVCGPDPTADDLVPCVYSACTPSPRVADPGFALSFDAPGTVLGMGTVSFGAMVEITNSDAVAGWSIGVTASGGDIVGATVDGTVAADVSEGGLFDTGYEHTELVAGGGAVSSVVLSLIRPVELSPASSPHRVLALTVKATAPAEGCSSVTLDFTDGLVGSGQPVPNLVYSIAAGDSVVPVTSSSTVDVCAGEPPTPVTFDYVLTNCGDLTAQIVTNGLSAGDDGVQGWAIGIAVDGGDCEFTFATTEGTVVPELFENGFEKNELGTCPGKLSGALSAVVLSLISPVTLDPGDSPHDVLKMTIEGTSSECRVFFVDGCVGTGAELTNLLTLQGESRIPSLGEITCTPDGGADADGDGVPDERDSCPDSDTSPTVVVHGCDSGVPNTVTDGGCAIADLVEGCMTIRDANFQATCFITMLLGLIVEDEIHVSDAVDLLVCIARSGRANIVGLTMPFIRGDANMDGTLNITDAIATLEFLFEGTAAPPCPDAADSNDDGRVDVSDPLISVGHLFLGTRPPAAPFPEPGYDMTDEDDMFCFDLPLF